MAILVLEHSPNFGAAILARTLRDFGQRLRFVRLHDSEPLPADLDDVSGVISCGGPQSAYGREPWLAEEMALLKEAHNSDIPVVGLCLGAQLLAKALGGEVAKAPKPEIGWFDISLDPVGREDSMLAGIPWKTPQFCWHSDQVTKLPPEGRLLASSALCKVHAFSVGLRSYAFQYHFEWDRALILKEITECDGELKNAGVTADQVRADTDRNFAVSERLARRQSETISLCLMPVDRINRGLVKDLHH